MGEVKAANTAMLAGKAQAQAQGILLRLYLPCSNDADFALAISDQSTQTRLLLGMLSRLGPAFDDKAPQIQSLQEQQDAERNRTRSLATREKLSSFPYQARYTHILQLRLSGTCRWVLVEPQYIA